MSDMSTPRRLTPDELLKFRIDIARMLNYLVRARDRLSSRGFWDDHLLYQHVYDAWRTIDSLAMTLVYCESAPGHAGSADHMLHRGSTDFSITGILRGDGDGI